jgi:ribonuclease R
MAHDESNWMPMTKRSGPPRKTAKPAKAAPWLPDLPSREDRKRVAGGHPPPPKPVAKAAAKAQPRPQPPSRAQPAAGAGAPRGPASRPQPRPHARIAIDDPFASRESQRYDQPIASREAIIAFLAERTELMTAERIAQELALTEPDRFDALAKRLSAMVRDGQLLVNRRGGYGVARKLDLIPGEVIANAEGYGFLRPDEGGDDLFLSPAQMRQVLHGDRVLASVVGLDRRGRREGAIVEVLERRSPRLVGRYQDQGGFGLVVPDERRIHQDVLIPAGRAGEARSGQIVVCEITEPPTRDRPPVGRVISVLGERLSASIAVQMAIESHGLPHDWPAAALADAAAVEPQVTAAEREGRVDLRELPLVTIDGEDARDFDDAVYAEPRGSGFRLVVAIADVSHYVRPGTALDDEAYTRATSVYFPDFVVPMLPETLSNGICSLNPRVERLCMVCDMLVDHDGEVTESRFYAAVMRSHARLTYTQVWKAIGEDDADARGAIGVLMPHILNLHQLYQLLAKQRSKRGAIEFESQEFQFKLAPTGEVLAMGAYERNDAHRLIEECMIAANVQAARYLGKQKMPAPYRVHAPPPAHKYEDLLGFLKEFQLRLPPQGEVTPGDFSALLRKVRKRPDAPLLESVLLRSQSLAVYQPANEGHFGLALDAYAHFTSPIRRYPDLLVHRAIRHALTGGRPGGYLYGDAEMETRAAHCSKCERRADEAERDVDERYKCAWMEKHVGSEFDGVVSGVTSFGLFTELVGNRVTGLVHVTQLPNDYYHFDARQQLLTGERRGLRFRLGDKVRVLVLRASLEDRKIDFRLVEPPRVGKTGTAEAAPVEAAPPRNAARGRRKR